MLTLPFPKKLRKGVFEALNQQKLWFKQAKLVKSTFYKVLMIE
jgi:hypothetical protein